VSQAAHPSTEPLLSRMPHPVVWTILYLPFGALSGFVTVALTHVATKHGLKISEAALLTGAQLLTQWMKWIWAPVVDVTLTPRKWYAIATSSSAVGVIVMSAIPLGPSTLGILLPVIALSSLVNSAVGMAVEAIMAASTPPDQVGRVSAWFQVGNLGGGALGGALGLFMIEKLPAPWMAGSVMGVLFVSCCVALRWTSYAPPHRAEGGALTAVKSVFGDLRAMLRTKGGLLSAVLCALPIGTGAAQAVLTQDAVAKQWGASAYHVELVQGLLAACVISAGCFAGGWLCQRYQPRTAYAGIGILLAIVAIGMALSPKTVAMYVVWSLLYAFVVGLAFSAFTAVVLSAIGHGSGATKYNIYASLSNFPIWWVGLLLGFAAERWGPRGMLVTEAVAGVLGVLVFAVSAAGIRRTRLAEA